MFAYSRDAQPAAHGPDPVHEGVITGPWSRLKVQESSPE